MYAAQLTDDVDKFPTYALVIYQLTDFICSGLRKGIVGVIGNELSKLSNWLLELFQLTSSTPEYIVNVTFVLYLYCIFVKTVSNAWANQEKVTEVQNQNTATGLVIKAFKSTTSVWSYPLFMSGKKGIDYRSSIIHTLILLGGVGAALSAHKLFPAIVFKAYSDSGVEEFPDELTFYKRLFTFQKYAAFLLANASSSIFWRWASCFYVSSDLVHSNFIIPAVYIIKAISFFIVRRVFRNCWNADGSLLGHYINLYLSPYTSYPCIVFSVIALILLVTVIGVPSSDLEHTIQIPSKPLMIGLYLLVIFCAWDISLLPRLVFETLRSDISSSGSYVLALYFFPFNYTGALSPLAFCMFTFIMFMETGARVASSALPIGSINCWTDVFNGILEYIQKVISSLSSIERYPLSVFLIGLYLLKSYIFIPSHQSVSWTKIKSD